MDSGKAGGRDSSLEGSPFEHLVVVVGLSGAGKTTVMEALADHGFFAIHHLPIRLLDELVSAAKLNPEHYKRSAVLLDTSTSIDVDELVSKLDQLSTSTTNTFLFLDCSTAAIVRRFSETRRPHPAFDSKLDATLIDAIERERALLYKCRERAHVVVDSSSYTVHDLRRCMRDQIERLALGARAQLRINFVSFGFKYGVPLDCDLVVDVRFLSNPYFVPELRSMNGLDKQVAEYVTLQPGARDFIKRYCDLLNSLIPSYIHEGKAYLNIGVGCTGGQHRSVALAQALSQELCGTIPVGTEVLSNGLLVSVSHRDIERS